MFSSYGLLAEEISSTNIILAQILNTRLTWLKTMNDPRQSDPDGHHVFRFDPFGKRMLRLEHARCDKTLTARTSSLLSLAASNNKINSKHSSTTAAMH
jgi:hypothetical protein